MNMNEIAEAMQAVATAAAWARQAGNARAADYMIEAGFLMEGAHRLLRSNDPRGASDLMNDAGAAVLLGRAQIAGGVQAGPVAS